MLAGIVSSALERFVSPLGDGADDKFVRPVGVISCWDRTPFGAKRQGDPP
jgi:hypothetical protein